MSDSGGQAYWRAVRSAYPEQRPLLSLNNAAVSPPPLVVEQASSMRFGWSATSPLSTFGAGSTQRCPA
jgi:hypothetical protein